MRVRRGRVSLRDQITASVKADAMYAAIYDKPPVLAAEMPAPAQKRIRHERAGTATKLEGEVQREIMEMLRRHPRVAYRIRINSGQFQEGDRYIRTVYGLEKDELLPDIHLGLFGGQTCWIESKREGWTLRAGDERAQKQAKFMGRVRAGGGRAGFATSVAEARRIIEGE